MAQPTLIDTDVALGSWHEGRPLDIDDGFAIVEALNATDIALVGITIEFGNAPLDVTNRIPRELVQLKRATVEAHRGAVERRVTFHRAATRARRSYNGATIKDVTGFAPAGRRPSSVT